MHHVNPVECSVFSVVPDTVEHVSNLCHWFVTRVHILTLWVEYFANATVQMHSERDTWRLRKVGVSGLCKKAPKWVIWRFFLIVPPKQWYGQICQRLIFTFEPARWRRNCERPNSTNSNPNSFIHDMAPNSYRYFIIVVLYQHMTGCSIDYYSQWCTKVNANFAILKPYDKQNISGNWLMMC